MDDDEEFSYNHEDHYNSIINDNDLNAELIALGWEPDSTPAPQKKATKPSGTKPVGSSKSNKPIDVSPPVVIDIGGIGDVDEANLQLTEEDLEDPDLLSQFDELSGGSSSATLIHGNAHSAAEPDFLNEEPEALLPPTQAVIKTSASTVGNTNLSPPPIPQRLSQGPSAPTTAAEAKALALKCKRDGNDSEALRWFKLAKQLDASVVQTSKSGSGSAAAGGLSTKSAPTPSTANRAAPARPSAAAATSSAVKASVPTSPMTTAAVASSSSSAPSAVAVPKGGDAFTPLEEALNEASLLTGREAKRLEAIDKRAAVAKFKEYKAYQQELVVLKSRRQAAGAQPALFRWNTVRTSKTIENLDIAEDQIRVLLEGANDLENVLADHTSRNISVSYTLNIGAKDEEGAGPPPVVTPQAKYESGKVDWNHQNTLSILKRGRHVQQVYARKKASFELTLHRGFFKSSMVLCQAVIPLNELLTKCEVGGVVPLTAVGAKEGVAVASAASAAKKGKAVGGTLRVILRIRSPLLTPEVVVTEERTLVVDPWPEIITVTPPPLIAATVSENSTRSAPAAVGVSSDEHSAGAGADPTAGNPLFARIPEKEKLDPHSPDLIESNDVLEYEIKYSSDLVASNTLEEDEQFSNQLRVQLLQAKMQILVYNVQNDLITMEAYLDKVKARVAADQILAVYFKTLGGEKENLGHALRIMKRIGIMKEELKNAEEAG